MTDEEIKALKASNPGAELHLLRQGQLDVEVVARTPSASVWRTFRKMATDESTQLEAGEVLCFSCVVSPDRDGLRKLFDRYPALPKSLTDQLGELVGAGLKVSSKKL